MHQTSSLARRLFLGFCLFTSALTLSAADGRRYEVDSARSSVQWHGEKVGANHTGTISLKSGWLTVAGGKITGGEFVVDMNSIVNTDLTSKGQNQKLVNHLKSDDFFNAKKFPESRFVITGVETAGAGAYQLTGDMTIRGVTMSLKFTAAVTLDGDLLRGTAKLGFDRAKHEVKFNSGSFATRLGDKLIYDNVPLEIELVAKAG